MPITYPRAGWRWLACTGEGGEGVDVGAGVLGRRGEAAGTGCEGVARMWIGYADVDRLAVS